MSDMRASYPLPLNHSWPLSECGPRFELGRLLDDDMPALPGAIDAPAHGIGEWECDLATDALTWSPAVYDVFGVPRDARLTRADSVAFYCEGSRAAMERLRAHAIKHRRGFTLDAEIRPDLGGRRWMRLIAAPICVDGRVVRLHGLKHIVPDVDMSGLAVRDAA